MKAKILLPLLFFLFFFPSTVYADTVKFETKEDAAVYLRNQMIAREKNVSFYLKSSEIGLLTDDLEYIMNLAFRHDRQQSEAGDYLESVTTCKPVAPSSDSSEDGYQPLKYTITSYTTDLAQEAVIKKEISRILKSLNLTGKTDLAKIESIYGYIVKHIKYTDKKQEEGQSDLYDTPYTALNYTALGLKYPQCRCAGFSALLYRMLLEAGIDCRIIKGTVPVSEAATDRHSWNIVSYKGYWFSCDATEDSKHPDGLSSFMVPGSSKSSDSCSSFQSYQRDNEYKGSYYSLHPMSTKAVLDPGLSVKLKHKKTISYRRIKKKKNVWKPVRKLTCKTPGAKSVRFKIRNAKKNKGITIDKYTGKITIKKGMKKGRYQLKIRVVAARRYGYKKSVLDYKTPVTIVIK